jgi:hypothetical protein
MLVYICSTFLLYNLYIFLENRKNNIISDSQSNNNQSNETKDTSIFSVKYIIVNKIKSYVLGVLTIPSLYLIYPILYNIKVNSTFLNIMGAIYASTDMSALFYNKKCHKSTYIHHIIVQLLYYYCYINSFDMDYGLNKFISIYCIFSTSAYIVNYRLAIRTVNNYVDEYEQVINDLSFVIYFTTSILNWLIQIYLLTLAEIEINFIEKTIFVLILGMIVNDDIFLMQYLYKNMDMLNNIKKLINHIKYKRVM